MSAAKDMKTPTDNNVVTLSSSAAARQYADAESQALLGVASKEAFRMLERGELRGIQAIEVELLRDLVRAG